MQTPKEAMNTVLLSLYKRDCTSSGTLGSGFGSTIAKSRLQALAQQDLGRESLLDAGAEGSGLIGVVAALVESDELAQDAESGGMLRIGLLVEKLQR